MHQSECVLWKSNNKLGAMISWCKCCASQNRIIIIIVVHFLQFLHFDHLSNKSQNNRKVYGVSRDGMWCFKFLFFVAITLNHIHSFSSNPIKMQMASDQYCWCCHKNQPNLSCTTCVRSFHISSMCLQSKEPPEIDTVNWRCPECIHLEKQTQTCKAM